MKKILKYSNLRVSEDSNMKEFMLGKCAGGNMRQTRLFAVLSVDD